MSDIAFETHVERPAAHSTYATIYSDVIEAAVETAASGGSLSVESGPVAANDKEGDDIRRMFGVLRQVGIKKGLRVRTVYKNGRRYFWMEQKEAKR